jgi:O-antigen/teichoic acid export membrane protein
MKRLRKGLFGNIWGYSMTTDTAKDAVINRRVLWSVISNYVGKFITLGVGFFLTPFILHQLGASSYGLFVVVGSVVAYGTLLDFGITGAIVKYVAEYRAKGQTELAHSLVATALCFYSVLGLIAITLSVIIAPIFPNLFNVPPNERTIATWLVLLMGIGVGVAIPCTAPSAVLQGLQRFDLANLINIIGTLLSTTATILILLLGGGVLGIVAVNIIVTIIMQVPSIWLIKGIAPELKFGWRGASRHLVRTIIPFSSSLFLLHITGQLQTKTDEIVIGAYMPISTVTPYAIARRLSELPQILTNQFMKVLMPLASELHAESDQTQLRSLYITGTRLTLALFLPIACVLIVLAHSILTVWVGATYAGYTHIVIILTIASLIDTSQWPAGSILQGMVRHQPLVIVSIGSALSNLALSIALIPHFGLTGVALGTLLPAIIESIGIVLPYAMRVIGVSLREAIKEIFWPALIPALPTVIVLYSLREALEPTSLTLLMVAASGGLVVYIFSYITIGASTIERRAYYNILCNTIRFATTRFKRS